MKPSIKKKLINICLPVVWLVACYFIGQHVAMPGRIAPVLAEQPIDAEVGESIDPAQAEQPEAAEGVETAEVQAAVEAEDAVEVPALNVTVHGAQTVDTDQIPWGFTAGQIELEDGTSAWLLTPGTSLTVEGTVQVNSCIHPWMAQTSDGARLLIREAPDGREREMDVTADWAGTNLAGETNDISLASAENEDGDWVILRFDVAGKE